jgi:hypothetical protein
VPLDAGFRIGSGDAILPRMAGAIFVRVGAEPMASGARTFEIWIVATDDPAAAEKAVREMVTPGRSVEAIQDLPSEETIRRLALPPGKAWLL